MTSGDSEWFRKSFAYLNCLLERLPELSIEVGVDDRVERGIEISDPLQEIDLELVSCWSHVTYSNMQKNNLDLEKKLTYK